MAELATTWQTEKTCKCGNHLVVEYEEVSDETGRITENSIRMVHENGHFRSRNWPNWVYCNCGRRHDLTKFKSYTPSPSTITTIP